jgi:hypothetical protein
MPFLRHAVFILKLVAVAPLGRLGQDLYLTHGPTGIGRIPISGLGIPDSDWANDRWR